MNILSAIEVYNNYLKPLKAEVDLWRVSQAIDNKNSFVIPSFVTYSKIHEMLMKDKPIKNKVFGVDSNSIDFIHSISIWAMNGKIVSIREPALELIHKIKIMDYIPPNIFYRFSSQALYIDNKVGNYDGALVCKDYISDSGRDWYALNIFLFDHKNVNGKQFRFMLPDANQKKSFSKLAEMDIWTEIGPFFQIYLYILNEYQEKKDFFIANGVDYIGFDLADRIEQNKHKKGYWRNGHWHTYWTKCENVDQFVMKLIQPIWVVG